MKRALITVLALLIVAGFTACQRPTTPSGAPDSEEPSRSSSASDAVLPDIDLQEQDLEKLRAQVTEFAVLFAGAFETTKEISPTRIGWYTFWELYEAGLYQKDEEGLCYFEKADVDAYIALRFGVDNFVYPQPPDEEGYPRFNVEKQAYVFYPAGGNPWIDVEIVGEERNGNEISYKIDLYDSALGVEQPEPIFRNQILYRFEIVRGQDEAILLRAVSATEVS